VELVTFGCAASQAESEIICGLLAESGLEGADVVVVNTCTVKSPTESKILRLLRHLERDGRNVAVAGCLPAARKSVADEFPRFSFIGVNTRDIVEAVSAAASGGRCVRIVGSDDKSCMPRVRANPVVGILPIAEGCLGGCSYCQTRVARGGLRSYPAAKLRKEAEQMVADGAMELWVTAQDTGAYGKDTGTSLPELLNELAGIDGDFRIRVGMMNPDHALSMLDEIVAAFSNDRIYKFLHLPVQSGDDGVLKDMGRRYTVDGFREVVKAFERLGTTLSTDVIVGYPTEDDTAFKGTVALVRDVKPEVLNISRYWPRPGTAAAKLKQLPGTETKRRSGVMNQLFRKVGLERNRKWLGWAGCVLVSEANADGTFTARNDWYKPVIVKGARLGERVNVKVADATYYDLRA
jgi:threonylcarbamoyladenosine tRNA methylthiotransferase CDKAL1